jgi:hypothetical protein
MALDLAGQAALAQDRGVFYSRVWAACQILAGYILGEDGTVASHVPRVRWAVSAIANRDFAAQSLLPVVCNDPVVTGSSAGDGSDITDAQLQPAVENAVMKFLTNV